MVYTDELQYHIRLKEGDVGKYVILPGDPGRCKDIATYFDQSKLVVQNREYTTYTGFLEGEKVSVMSTGIGGPSAAIGLEELVRIGADTFIRVGTSGGLNENVMGGDLVIATGAIRMEGTTKEYVPVEFPAVADYDVTTALINSAKKEGYKYHVGVVECKDSFYGQHEAELKPIGYELVNKRKAWIKAGALASEMESAALFVIGSTLGVRVGTVLAVIANQTRREMGLEDLKVYETNMAIETAILALRELILKDRK